MLVISCHADTNFTSHSLEIINKDLYKGYLDNFAGVYAVMKAYFSGKLNYDYLHIELTYGEEKGCLGAYELLNSLEINDVVCVVDVTGIPTQNDFTIEKCRDKKLYKFLTKTLKGMKFDIYPNCPDPISTSDEVDIYVNKCKYVFFLGIPLYGGDYNSEKVICKKTSIESVSKAICKIVKSFPLFCKDVNIKVY